MAHKDLTGTENHVVHSQTYATRAAMLAATTASGDVGKIVKVTDEDAYYIVKTSGSPGTFLKGNAEVAKTSTTDATATVAYSFTMEDNSAIALTCKILAMETDGSDRGFNWITGVFYRDGGSATQQGSTANIITAIESDASWAVEFQTSGNDVRVRVTGDAATNITWITETELTHVI